MKTVKKIALIALLWITVINSGTLGTLDTELRLQMAHAWWTGTEEVQIPPGYKLKVRGDIQAGVIGVGGKRYIAYEEGQSMLMLPGDWVGTQLHRWFPTIPEENLRIWAVNFLIFIPLNVAAVVACFQLLRLFDFGERIAGLTSLTWLMGTTMLHYAQVHQHNNQVLLLVIIGYAAALACVLRDRPRLALISGLVVGGTLLLRISSTIHALTILLFLVGCLAYQYRDQLMKSKSHQLKILKILGLWIVGFIPFTLIGRIFDYIRYGSFLATGKSVEQLQLTTDPMWAGLPDLPAGYPLINPPYVGILGPILAPAKSIFIYDPLLLPCLVLGIIFWKRFSPYIQWYLITGLLNLGLHLLAYSKFFFWHGDSAWGARYHVTSVQLLLIPLLAVFIQNLLSSKGLTTWLMRGILTLAIIVQIASVAMPINLEIYQTKVGIPGTRFSFRIGQRINNIVCQFNGSFSKLCTDRNPAQKPYLEEVDHLFFLPFTVSQEAAKTPVLDDLSVIFLILWVLMIILATGATVWFIWAG